MVRKIKVENTKQTRPRTGAVEMTDSNKSIASQPLTDKEVRSRLANRKFAATTTFGAGLRKASGGDVMDSSFGNFYSPQLSTDFLEKPQNLRERRAFYRHFYNSNEFVGQAVDLHSTLPLSKLRLDKPHATNQDLADYVYDFYTDMCSDMKLFKTLIEISHEFVLFGNCFIFANEHDPYEGKEEGEIAKLKEVGKHKSQTLFEKFKITDKDPNYGGWKKLIVLPPDQVRVQKLPLSDETKIEFIPDPETRKTIMAVGMTSPFHEEDNDKPLLPDKLVRAVQEGGTIPLDTDPSSGSHVFHLARKKSQYETMGVSIIERCINTLVLNDKLRQAQTSIASRHMTPIRIVWAEELGDLDVSNLREQVDLALMDPDFSIITNYQVHWEEMGVSGRLLELSTEYEHQENSLFAGLGVTREILTGEGTYTGNRVTLEIMNTQYLLFRELIQDYVENNIFKPVARKKGFIETDKFGREKLIYPKLSFTRLAIRDNDSFFDQTFQLYNKGSVSIDVILDMLNIDPVSTKKKIEADLFTVNDAAFNDLIRNLYTAIGPDMATKTDALAKLSRYLNLTVAQEPAPEAEDTGESNSRFAKIKASLNGNLEKANVKPGMTDERKAALLKVMESLSDNPQALDKIEKSLK